MNLLVGCPVRDRAWILPAWFDHVEAACARADVVPSYIFAVGAGDPSWPAIGAFSLLIGRSVTVVETGEQLSTATRGWHLEARLRHMVEIRNLLLDAVREIGPDLFLSLDSDILLHSDAVANLVESTQRFGAVGGAAFMSNTEEHPNCGWVEGMTGFTRQRMEHRGVIPVGVIMAVKMMGPAAYSIDYAFSVQGEDIGWSLAAGEAGVRLGWDNRVINKHVMTPVALGVVDERCGF